MGIARGAWSHVSALAVFANSLSLLGCGSAEVLGDFPSVTCDFAEAAPSSRKTPLRITSFWNADPEEAKALGILTGAVDAQRFDVDLDMEGLNNRINTQLTLQAAFLSERLPDVFQVNAGSDLLRWVTSRRPDAAEVCSLDGLAEAYDWPDSYYPQTLAPLRCHEQLYGLPIGVHRLNNLFYNRDLFEQLKKQAMARGKPLIEPDQLRSVEDLLAELRLVNELGYVTPKGKTLVPLSVSSLNDGPLTILAFENVLLSLGQRAYEVLWQGELTVANEGSLRQALSDMVERLRELVDLAGETRISWQKALQDVGDGEALFTVNGDWGWAQLLGDSASAVSTTPFPGTSDAFVYTPDSFSVPREQGKNGFAAKAFLRDVVANEDVLLAFSNQKHSLPPHRGLDLSQLATEEQRRAYERFEYCSQGGEGCRLLLAVSGLAPPPGDEDCFDDIEPLMRLAVTRQPLSDTETNQLCYGNLPKSAEEAKQKLIAILLAIGKQRFAADCR